MTGSSVVYRSTSASLVRLSTKDVDDLYHFRDARVDESSVDLPHNRTCSNLHRVQVLVGCRVPTSRVASMEMSIDDGLAWGSSSYLETF